MPFDRRLTKSLRMQNLPPYWEINAHKILHHFITVKPDIAIINMLLNNTYAIASQQLTLELPL